MSTWNNPANVNRGVNKFDYLGRKQDATALQTTTYYVTSLLPSTLSAFENSVRLPHQ